MELVVPWNKQRFVVAFAFMEQLPQASLSPKPEDRIQRLLLFSFILFILLFQCVSWLPSQMCNIWKCDSKVVIFIFFHLFIFIFEFRSIAYCKTKQNDNF